MEKSKKLADDVDYRMIIDALWMIKNRYSMKREMKRETLLPLQSIQPMQPANYAFAYLLEQLINAGNFVVIDRFEELKNGKISIEEFRNGTNL